MGFIDYRTFIILFLFLVVKCHELYTVPCNHESQTEWFFLYALDIVF